MTKEPIHIAMASKRQYLPGLRATTVSLVRAAGLDPSHYLFYYLDDAMREIDLLISRSGRLYPVEIKISANLGIDAMRHFTVIDEMGVERAPGCVLSLVQNPIPVRDKGLVVNVATLWGQGNKTKNVTDVDATADVRRQCYGTPDLRHEVGEKGRQFVEDHFSIANFKKSVDAFLDGNVTDVL